MDDVMTQDLEAPLTTELDNGFLENRVVAGDAQMDGGPGIAANFIGQGRTAAQVRAAGDLQDTKFGFRGLGGYGGQLYGGHDGYLVSVESE